MFTLSKVSSEPLLIERAMEILAPLTTTWEALLEQLGPGNEMGEGVPFPMKLEAWPGGRWYRDLGEGVGHLWGHIQVIKPPKLLEIYGPLFMSYAVLSHVQYRLIEERGHTRLQIIHRAIGEIEQQHREGVVEGWQFELDRIKQRAEKIAK